MVQLTEMEIEIAEYAAQGLNNSQIAEKMFISVHTVKSHIAIILKKLSAANRANIVYKAMKNKLIE